MRLVGIVSVLLVIACGEPGAPSGDGAVEAGDGGSVQGDGGASDGAAGDLAPGDPCAGTIPSCASATARRRCVATGGVATWQDEPCAKGCFQGACSTVACADECTLGDTGAAGSCKLWSLGTGAFLADDEAASTHDRARRYAQRLYRGHVADGGVVVSFFTDETLATLSYQTATGDSALWTGTALAAEAFRLRATGSPEAARRVEAYVRYLHVLFNVSGDPGYMVRYAHPTSSSVVTDEPLPCVSGAAGWWCGASFEGKTYDWRGRSSRDAYTGAMLGLAAAYDATSDEAVRKLIREDVVSVATELMKVRSVEAKVRINGGAAIPRTLQLENVILALSEVADGKVLIDLDTAHAAESDIYGMREFVPDFGPMVQQVFGLGIPVPRASTTIMLGAFFTMALHMTDAVPGYEAVHQQLATYYAAKADGWLAISEGWSYGGSCSGSYFPNHLAIIMAYVFATLEQDPTRKARIRDNILDGKMWAALSGHRNSYFAFLWGGTRPSSPDAGTMSAAAAQLAQFPPGPRVHVAVDRSADPQYEPHDSQCTNPPICDHQSCAVEVGQRPVAEFLWQMPPWLLVDGGEPREVFPGVDYLVAYWLGRHHGFVTDDHPGTCARWQP